MAPWLTSIFSKGTSTLVESIGNAFDKNFTTKEEKEALKLELLKEVNNNIQSLEELARKEYEAEVADRDSARRREVELAKATGHIDYLQWFLAISSVVMFFYIIYNVVNGLVSEKNEGLAHNIMGIIEGIVLSVFSYYFGSSAGSRVKDMKSKT